MYSVIRDLFIAIKEINVENIKFLGMQAIYKHQQ